MELVYTDTMTLTTAEVLIKKNRSSTGDGNIPDVRMKEIVLTTPDGTLSVKGTHSSSEWLALEAGEGYKITDLDHRSHNLLYVKGAGSCTLNIHVFGEQY